MWTLPFCHGTIPVLLTGLLIAVSFCYADQTTVQVIGFSECANCQKDNIKHTDAVKGLRVTIDCKLENGKMKTRGEGKVDGQGKFHIDFPHELVENGKKLNEECYAQLHGASNLPCPAHDGIESTKLAYVSESDGKHTFSPVGKLKFSSEICTSEFLWPHYKYPYYKHPWFKKPYYYKHPLYKHPWFKKPYYSIPKYTKPNPPVYKTPTVPVYKKPYPPVYKTPYVPVPVYKKPYPPVYVTPSVPIYKKPCPPITIPKIYYPPKVYYEHPWFKKWPPKP
ncbi:proline-rich protein 4 [Amaranthus tricolor]|uniref:proline-rich protein 4 n=1 Tax=Amaranthus tricolor TaxID=29722 RepID=UPI00258D137A|nr:proline-rich protein 4 [Amaranthus tricolor]